MNLTPLLAQEARIASLECQLKKALARIDRLEATKPRPKPVPIYSNQEKLDRIAMGKIAAKVAEKYNITAERMRSRDKRRVFMMPRWEAWTLCNEAGYSTPVIGRFFGGRDHTTILHGIGRWREMSKAPG